MDIIEWHLFVFLKWKHIMQSNITNNLELRKKNYWMVHLVETSADQDG